jgi:hypothetical protein
MVSEDNTAFTRLVLPKMNACVTGGKNDIGSDRETQERLVEHFDGAAMAYDGYGTIIVVFMQQSGKHLFHPVTEVDL